MALAVAALGSSAAACTGAGDAQQVVARADERPTSTNAPNTLVTELIGGDDDLAPATNDDEGFFTSRRRTSKAVIRAGRLTGSATVIDRDASPELNDIYEGTFEVSFDVERIDPKVWSGTATVDGRRHLLELRWPGEAITNAGYTGYVCVDAECSEPTFAGIDENDRRVLFNVFSYELLMLTFPGGFEDPDLDGVTGRTMVERYGDGSTLWSYVWFGARPWPSASLVSEEGCEVSHARLSMGLFRSTRLEIPGCGDSVELDEGDLPALDPSITYSSDEALFISRGRTNLVERAQAAGSYAVDVDLHATPTFASPFWFDVGDYQLHLEVARVGPTSWQGFGTLNGGTPIAMTMEVTTPDEVVVCLEEICDGFGLEEPFNLWVVGTWTARLLATPPKAAEITKPTVSWNLRLADRLADGSLLWSSQHDLYELGKAIGTREMVGVTSAEGCENLQFLREEDGGRYTIRHRVPGCGDADLVGDSTVTAAADAWPNMVR